MANKKLYETVGSIAYDNLIVDNFPPADVYSVTVTSGEGKLTRGTVLALSTGTAGTGKMRILGTTAGSNETLDANCILAEDVDATSADATALAYRTGHFNRQALIVKTEYTFKLADEEALRKGGILLSDAL